MSARFELREVEVALGGRTLLRGVSVDLPLTGVVAVVGRSGSGKSVLCRALVGMLELSSGSIALRGVPGLADGLRVDQASEATRVRVRRAVPLVVQGAHLLDWLTVLENVALAAPDRPRAEAEAALARLGLAAVAGRLPRQLGPGPQKLAALARALLLGPRALILDEPTTGLDDRAADAVWEALAGLARDGLGLVVVSHDPRALDGRAGLVVEVAGGELGYVGAAAGFRPLASRAPPHG